MSPNQIQNKAWFETVCKLFQVCSRLPSPLEEDGVDSPVKTLRSALQHYESKGLVDFTLGGAFLLQATQCSAGTGG